MEITSVTTQNVALLIYGHRAELLTRLIEYLAIVSYVIWAVVLVSMVVRFGARRLYGRQGARRRL